MGSSSSPSNTTQTTEPPKFLKPFLEYGAQQAGNLYSGTSPQQYGGPTVVPFAPQTEQALALTQQRALNGSPVVDAAQGFATRTLNASPTSSLGSVANPFGSQPRQFDGASNPYLDATFNRAADQVQNRLQSSFAGAGRNIGAGRAPAALELNDLANTIYGGAYESDRNRSLSELQQLRGIGATGFENSQNRALDDIQQQRQQQLAAAGFAPTLAAQDYADIAALQGVGGSFEDLTGRQIDDAVSRFNFDQEAPQMNLDRYLARLQGVFPGQTTTQSMPQTRNRTSGALGGAATGASLGSAFGPYGAAIGGIAGGLYGAFG